MTEKELIKKLKACGKEFRKQTKISKSQKEAGWNLIMSEIDFSIPAKESFISRLAETIAAQKLVFKPVAAFSMALVLFVVFSFATVNASKNTLPGNPFYNFKIAAEKIRYILAFSEQDRARMSMDISQRRAKEFAILVSREENSLTAAQVSLQIKDYLTDVKTKFSKINQEEKDAKKVVAMADSINENIKDIEKAVNAIKSDNLKNNAQEVLAQTDDIKLVVLAALVGRYTAGEIELSEEKLQEAKDILDNDTNKDADDINVDVINTENNLFNNETNSDIISTSTPTSTPTTTESVIQPQDPYFGNEAWTLENEEINNKEFKVLIK